MDPANPSLGTPHLLERRRFTAVIASGLLAAPLAAQAQQTLKVPRVGWLSPGSATSDETFLASSRDALRELGGMVGGGDPLGSGLVASLARPGENVTGPSSMLADVSGKQLELLKETVPKATRVAVLWNPANPVWQAAALRETEVAARALGLRLQLLEARGPDELEGAFAAMTRERAGALFVPADIIFVRHAQRLADLAAKHRLPAMYGFREHVEAGGLMSYAASFAVIFRRAATFVDKILKGAKAGELPVEQPTKFELVINLKTAKTLGITIPQSVLVRADEVIQ